MQIKINIQPKKMHLTNAFSGNMYSPVKSNAQQLREKLLKNFGYSFTSYSNGAWCKGGNYVDYETVRAFHLEKRRKRVEIKKTKKGTVRSVVSPAHWVATYYDIPVELLKMSGLIVVQGNRNFTLMQQN